MTTEPLPDSTEPIAEGRVALVFPWGGDRVLKLSRDWVPRSWIEYEYRIAAIVQATGLQVPWAHEIIEVNGQAGIVYDRLSGPTMLDRIGRSPQKAAGFGRIMGRLHAEMHNKTASPDLPDNIDRLRGKISSVKEAPAVQREAALRSLDKLPGGSALLHGDFHPGNIMLTPKGPVTIDWPDATRGHPLADVARSVVLASMGGVPANPILRVMVLALRQVFKQAYLSTYFKSSPLRRRDLDGWLYPVLFARLAEGIESEREMTIRWLKKLSRN